MTRLALGAKCGARLAPVEPALPVSLPLLSLGSRSDASAAAPMPTAVRPSRCRRVRRSLCSSKGFTGLSFGEGFVEVQNRVGHDSPGRELRDIQGLVPARLADLEKIQGPVAVPLVDRELLRPQSEQDLALPRIRRPGRGEPEGEIDARLRRGA